MKFNCCILCCLEMFAVVVSIHVVLLALAVVGLPAHHQLEARQSSDGCGPNPLVAVISYAREFGKFSFILLDLKTNIDRNFIKNQRISALISWCVSSNRTAGPAVNCDLYCECTTIACELETGLDTRKTVQTPWKWCITTILIPIHRPNHQHFGWPPTESPNIP